MERKPTIRPAKGKSMAPYRIGISQDGKSELIFLSRTMSFMQAKSLYAELIGMRKERISGDPPGHWVGSSPHFENMTIWMGPEEDFDE